VSALELRRWDDALDAGTPASQISLGPTEIARIRADLDDPQAGLVTLVIEGGR
jgi:hypothetical protein